MPEDTFYENEKVCDKMYVKRGWDGKVQSERGRERER